MKIGDTVQFISTNKIGKIIYKHESRPLVKVLFSDKTISKFCRINSLKIINSFRVGDIVKIKNSISGMEGKVTEINLSKPYPINVRWINNIQETYIEEGLEIVRTMFSQSGYYTIYKNDSGHRFEIREKVILIEKNLEYEDVFLAQSKSDFKKEFLILKSDIEE